MANPVLNILVSGVGGQGTVLAGKLLASCALSQGAFVRSAETIGMAQRGGSVLGHVRITSAQAPELLSSPLIPQGQAHILIGFEPNETLRSYAYCKEGACIITATKPVASPLAALKKMKYDGTLPLLALEQEAAAGAIKTLVTVNNDEVMQQLGFDKALNVVLLGAALKALEHNEDFTSEFLSYQAMQTALKETVKEKYVQANLQALEMGYQL